MRNEGARIQNRLELVYYRFVRFTSSRILDEQKHKNGRALFSTQGEIRLCSQGTICHESFFTSVPGPKAIAEKLDHDNIKVLIEQYLAGEDKLDLLVWEMTEFDSSEPMVATEDMLDREHKDDQEHKAYGRDINKCKTLLVGDQGTNKIIRSVKQKSQSAYEWAAEVPDIVYIYIYI
jgi:hypothetical protein